MSPSFRSLGPERTGFLFPLRLMRGRLALPGNWSVGSAEASRARGQDAGYWLIVAWGAIIDARERGHWDGDKQCYVVGHVYAPSCAASVSDSCAATSAS